MSAEFPEFWSTRGCTASAVCFLLDADSAPGLLPRLLQPFARRDLVPDGLRSRRIGARLQVEITIDLVPPEVIAGIEGNLNQVVGVRNVTRLSPPGQTQFS
jgi:acetolactate synthase small subunit